ncbi:MAG: acyloxyacyl hydrolase [Candidatus Rokubacteria bacterium]|nr:acyloxyacyl hydrolase [Candidatus Rokubacteria bacterium]MBI3826647.1 acyloxyacyl hydrolase [Candidatus Rokubacteria bacterium]
MRRGSLSQALALAVLVAVPAGAGAFEPEETFKKGAWVLSLEGGGGSQSNLEKHRVQTGLDMVYGGVRLSVLPFGTTLGVDNPLYGAFELGLEPIYQLYTSPTQRYYAGLGLEFKYHFLAIGRFVPYAELFAAAGGTDLKAIEINSVFTFLLFGGVGAQYFVTDRTALYAGYRLDHVSNGHLYKRNRGFEANTGMAGVSFFFP